MNWSNPVGIAYAICSGLDIIFPAPVGPHPWGLRSPDPPAVIGLALIVTGVVVVNGFSRSIGH